MPRDNVVENFMVMVCGGVRYYRPDFFFVFGGISDWMMRKGAKACESLLVRSEV